jgi:hypothetical protein
MTFREKDLFKVPLRLCIINLHYSGYRLPIIIIERPIDYNNSILEGKLRADRDLEHSAVMIVKDRHMTSKNL